MHLIFKDEYDFLQLEWLTHLLATSDIFAYKFP